MVDYVYKYVVYSTVRSNQNASTCCSSLYNYYRLISPPVSEYVLSATRNLFFHPNSLNFAADFVQRSRRRWAIRIRQISKERYVFSRLLVESWEDVFVLVVVVHYSDLTKVWVQHTSMSARSVVAFCSVIDTRHQIVSLSVTKCAVFCPRV